MQHSDCVADNHCIHLGFSTSNNWTVCKKRECEVWWGNKVPPQGLIRTTEQQNDTERSDGSSDKRTGNEGEKLMDWTGPLLMGSALTWLMASVHTERQTRLGGGCVRWQKRGEGRGLASAAICFAVVLARGSLLQPILKALFVLTFQGKKKKKPCFSSPQFGNHRD